MNEIDKEIALFKNQLSAIKLAAGFKKEIVEKLQVFFLDLKQGYTFTAKKERIALPERFFYIDLVFYNRISRSFILVNFRNGELNEQDLEKMQLAIDYYNNEKRLETDNKTIGITIGKEDDDMSIEYILDENFAKKDSIVLPNEEQLKQLFGGN
jgi:hypothetical protein